MELFKNYKFKTELHAHTKPVSACSEIIPERLIELYKQKQVDAVCITNHFYSGYFKNGTKEEKIKEYVAEFEHTRKLGEKNGINVILGIEIRFTENINDYLVYGIGERELEYAYEFLDKGIDEFYKAFKNDNNVILQAHPFRDGMELANINSIDGIEVFNMHPHQNSRVSFAAAYAAANNFLVSGGTDFHHENHQAQCLVRTEFKPVDSFDIAKIIKEKNFVFDIGNSIAVPYNFSA